jgi:hypothetical protein
VTASEWFHGGGDDDMGRCLACIMQAEAYEYEEPVRPHRPWPDSDSPDDDIWCWICGHSLVMIGGDDD